MQKTLYASVIFALLSWGANNIYYLAVDVARSLDSPVELSPCNDI